MKRATILYSTVASAILLSACGGSPGGGGTRDNPADVEQPPVPSYAEGLWLGETSENWKVRAFVFPDDSFYVFYAKKGNLRDIIGFVQGRGKSDSGKFTSSSATDFIMEEGAPQSTTLDATYIERESMQWTFTDAGGQSSSIDSTFHLNYDLEPTPTALKGSYLGTLSTLLGKSAATVHVALDGQITGTTANGCSFAGTGTPRGDGNAYDIRLSFGGAPCAYADTVLTGLAFLHPSGKRLYAGAATGDKSGAVLFMSQ